MNCGVLEWVDAPWPVILQRCLTKLWDMYHEENLGRVQDKEAHEIEVEKLKKELDSLGNQYSQLVDDVSKTSLRLFTTRSVLQVWSIAYLAQAETSIFLSHF